MNNETLEILYLTPDKDKISRFNEAVEDLMGKYFDLVWLARKDMQELMEEEKYEILAMIKEIEQKYPEEVKALDGDDTNWHHGFNSGMLACCRYLSEYVEDNWWPLEDTGGVDIPEEEIEIINGKPYVQFDGREQAREMFPELDT